MDKSAKVRPCFSLKRLTFRGQRLKNKKYKGSPRNEVPSRGILVDNPIARASRIIGLVSINIFIWQILRRSESESWDKLIYLTSAVLGIYGFYSKAKIWRTWWFYVIAVVPLFLGIIGIEKHGTQTTSGVDVSGLLWLGFGPFVLITTILFLPYFFKIFDDYTSNKVLRILIPTISLIAVVLTIIAAWQTVTSIIDPYSSEYVLNESLVISAGHLPEVDFIPQYGTVFAMLLAPWSHSLAPLAQVNFILIAMFVVTLIDIAIAVYLVRSILKSRRWLLAISLVVPLTSITQLPNRKGFAGSIYDLIQELPERLFPGMVTGLLLFLLLTKNLGKKWKLSVAVGLGFLSGFSIWLNQDFAVLSGLLSVGFAVILIRNRNLIFFIIGTYVFGALSYPLAIAAFTNKIVKAKFLGFFVIQYGGGQAFMAEPIKTPGPVLIILPVIVMCASINFFYLFKHWKQEIELPTGDYHRVLVGSYFGLWCLGGFLYYLNRSYASGQMQILFLPLTICMVSSLQFIVGRIPDSSTWVPLNILNPKFLFKNREQFKHVFVVAICGSLLLGASIGLPDPKIELKRITSAPVLYQWPPSGVKDAIKVISQIKKNSIFNGKKVAYFGAGGNYVQIVTGIESANILNSPWDMPVSQNTITTGCQGIWAVNADYLVLGAEALSLFRFKNNSLCENYYIANIPGLPKNSIAVRQP